MLDVRQLENHLWEVLCCDEEAKRRVSVPVPVSTCTGFIPQRGMYTSGSKKIASPPPTCTSICLFYTISTAQWNKKNESG